MNSGLKQTFTKNSIWCKERTHVEGSLILLTLIVLTITIITLAISLAVVVHNSADDTEVCSTPGCIHAASTVLKYIDSAIDPCDDFFEFACGGFIKENIIPDDRTEIGAGILYDKIRDQIKAIIEEPPKPRAKRPFKMLKQFYDLCMNTTAIEADGLETAKQILKDLGGWPLLEGENWNEVKFDWKQSVYKFRKLGFSNGYFLSFSVGIDAKNSSRHTIYLDQTYTGLSREFLIKGLEEKLVKAYYKYMVGVAVVFGANKAAAMKELKETLEFEIKLANISLPKEKRRNSTLLYNPMSVEQLKYRYSRIDWLEYLNNVLNIPDIEITYDDMVVVLVPKYITDLINLLQRTPKRVQANYVMRRAADTFIFYLTEELREKQIDYYKIIVGQRERQSRWKECTELASGSLHLASGSLYIQKHFKENAKKQVQEMMADIRAEFVKMLKEVDWMDDKTRQNALEKAASTVTHIGYPDELLDEEKIDKYYNKLEVNPDSYLRTVEALSLFRTEYAYQKLRKPVNKTDWLDHSYSAFANAFYSPFENSIVLNAGILQGIFFGDDRPAYLNYGGIGYIIGHEITHGFDDQCRQYNKDGNLDDWWEQSTKEAFAKKAQCIIDQYGNYTVPEIDINLNGINTQGENIADNGGIKEAYLAYNRWVERNGQEPHLPGVDYTPNQLFWISAAQSRCSKSRKEALKLYVTLDSHAPARYRVLVPFANTEYFAKDFNCLAGSTMNPVHKCTVW